MHYVTMRYAACIIIMDAFFRYLREPHILEDFKSTFDLSAKFKYPEPSEVQKSKYFE